MWPWQFFARIIRSICGKSEAADLGRSIRPTGPGGGARRPHTLRGSRQSTEIAAGGEDIAVVNATVGVGHYLGERRREAGARDHCRGDTHGAPMAIGSPRRHGHGGAGSCGGSSPGERWANGGGRPLRSNP